MLLQRWANRILDLCYPGTCAACGGVCAGAALVCDSCDLSLAALESAPACLLCAMPVQQPGAPCQFCQGKGVAHYGRIARLGVFEGSIKELIHQLKYRHRWPLATFLADRLYRRASVRVILDQADCILAVPLHPLRHISRGYNQSDLIARRLAKRARVRLVRPLVRLRNTPTQTALHSRARREENLHDAFGMLRPRSVRGRRLVVVDDVLTTGATLQSAARALLEAEPATLGAIVVAVADPLHQGFQHL